MIAHSNVLLRNQTCLWAIFLSLTVHLGLLFCFGHWKQSGQSGSSFQGEVGVPIAVQLEIAAGSRQEVSASVLTASNEKGEAPDRPVPQKESGKKSSTLSRGDAVFAATTAGQTHSTSQVTLPEPHYFRSDELTEKPQVLHDVSPDSLMGFPDVFTRPLALRLLINEQGDVDKVVIQEALLSRKAVQLLEETFSKIKFLPGKVGDMPVKSQITIQVSLQHAPVLVSPPTLIKP